VNLPHAKIQDTVKVDGSGSELGVVVSVKQFSVMTSLSGDSGM